MTKLIKQIILTYIISVTINLSGELHNINSNVISMIDYFGQDEDALINFIISKKWLKNIKVEKLKGLLYKNYVIFKQENKKGLFSILLLPGTTDEAWQVVANPLGLKELFSDKLTRVIKVKDKPLTVFFELKLGPFKIGYTVEHQFKPKRKFLKFNLDHTVKNDIKNFQGFWKLYSYKKGTIAYYWTYYNVSSIMPMVMQNYFLKKNLPETIEAIIKGVYKINISSQKASTIHE